MEVNPEIPDFEPFDPGDDGDESIQMTSISPQTTDETTPLLSKQSDDSREALQIIKSNFFLISTL